MTGCSLLIKKNSGDYVTTRIFADPRREARSARGDIAQYITLNSFGDNSAFLDLLYWSQNYHFQPGIPLPRINAYNFAIN